MTGENEEPDPNLYPWTATVRFVASILIGFYLFIVLLGPMSNPIASEHLTAPASRLLAPLQQSLYLDHGYRFFGPNPGPSHLVFYKVKQANGETIEGHFPDRDKIWPRLLYHRWFMLSETLFEQHAFTPSAEAFDEEQQAIEKEIGNLRAAGDFEMVELLEKDKLQLSKVYETSLERISEIVDSLESHLLERYDGESVELFLRERLLADPIDVRRGIKLDDDRYLSPLIPIGSAAENARSDMESLPTTQESADGF